MAATVQLWEKNNVSPTATDKTAGTIRFKNADDPAVDLNNPMVKPAVVSPSVVDWSFEKWLRFVVTGGSYTQITGVKFYMDGANGWTGVNLWAKAVTAFTNPAVPTSSSGFTNAFTYTSGSPLTLGAGPFTSTGEKADHLVMAMEVTDQAVGGVLTAETLTIAWDEI